MRQPRRDADLAEKPLRLVPSRGWPQHLDCHLAGVLEVFGEVNRCGAAAADLFLDHVAIGDGGPQTVRDVEHA